MAADDRCHEVEVRLAEAFLARREASPADRAHIEGCRRCGAARAELSRLSQVLDPPLAPLSAAREQTALAAARAARRDAPEAEPAHRAPALPPGFARELGRLLLFAGLPVPLLVLWYAELARIGSALLAHWLPAVLAPVVGAVLALGAASWLGLVYGALPFVAHRRAIRRNEVTA
jgi:hypothetical protein